MIFLPKHTPFHAFAVRLKPWQRYVGTFAICCLLISGTFVALIKLTALTTVYKQELQTARLLLQEHVHAAGANKKLHEQVEDLQHALNQVAASTQGEQSIACILNKALESNLIIKNCTHQQEIDKPGYTKHIVVLEATGTLNQIRAFLEKLRMSKKMIQCRSLHVTHSAAQSMHMLCTLSARAIKPEWLTQHATT